MKLSDFRVATRLGTGFTLVLVLLITIALTAGILIKRVNDNGRFYFENVQPSLDVVSEVRGDLENIRRAEANHILANSDEEMNAFEQRIASKREQLNSRLASYEKLLADDEDRRLWLQAQSSVAAYLVVWNKIQPLSRQTNTDPTAMEKARSLFATDGLKTFDAALRSLEAMWDHNETLGQAKVRDADAAYDTAKVTLAGLGILALALGGMSALLIARSVTRPLTQAQVAVGRLAEGDLTVTLNAEGSDEIAQLIQAVSHMKDNLTRTVTHMRQNAETVASVSAQIAHGNLDMSQRTEEQASALEETSASMEELGSSARQNADNVKQATQLALGASSVATQGGVVVDQVVDTMKSINEASKKIADIINVIDGIAFQTNILALNAAVEAARAGEQGRGFAVVASEVRSLAQRSAEAAKEIKTLITTSVERVARGTVLVDQAGTTMSEVVTSIKRVTDLMNEINVASNEQSSNVAQVSNAVTQMDRVTQQNAALVEESAAAADSLKQQAHDLVQAVAVFKLAPGSSGAGGASVMRPSAKHRPAVSRPVPRPAARPPARVTESSSAPALGSGSAKVPDDDDWTTF